MESELIELFEKVKKAADKAAVGSGAAEEDRCLDALNRLKEFRVNYNVLVSTQVGKRLRQLTKHPRKKIQAFASDIVDMWKGIIVQETLNKNNVKSEAPAKAQSSGEETDVKKFQRVNSLKVEKQSTAVKVEKQSTAVKVEKQSTAVKVERVNQTGMRTSEKIIKSETSSIKTEKSASGEHVHVEKIRKEEQMHSDVKKPVSQHVGPPKLTSLVLCKDAIRDKVREILAEALCKVPSEVDDDLSDQVNACDPYRVAVLVEDAMFEKWGRSNGAQKFKYRSIMFNIKDPNNPDFRRKVLLGQFQPHAVPDLTPDQMASDSRQQENNKIKQKMLFDCERGAAPKASTNEFKCGRCGKRECTYYQMQTRSADEPMTTFVTCVNCNNHWKFC